MHLVRSPLIRCRNWLLARRRRRELDELTQQHAAPMSVLFYHRVADEHPNDWTISRADFQRHVAYCRKRFELIGLDEVQRRVHRNDSPRPAVTFTFDDGYAENCQFALPLLIRHRVPTVYFVATQHVLDQRPFPHDVAAGLPLPVNTVEQLRAAADGGIEIGLHTRNHVDFSLVRQPREIRREIVAAKGELENLIGRPVRYFAVPYGFPRQITQAVVDAVGEAGLRGFCSAFGAYNLPGRDPFHIRRIHGDPEFARLENWLAFDRRKVRGEPNVAYLLPPRAPDFGRDTASTKDTHLAEDTPSAGLPPVEAGPHELNPDDPNAVEDVSNQTASPDVPLDRPQSHRSLPVSDPAAPRGNAP